MIPNQAQPAIQGGQTQTPTLPPPTDNTLFNADPAALDFGFDETTGTFGLQFKKAQETAQPDTTKVEETKQPDSQQQSPNIYEDRFGRIEGAIINLAGLLQGLQSGSQNSQQVQQTEEAPNLDVNSGDFASNLVNIINSAIEKKFSSFEEKLKPLNTDIAKVNERITITDLATKYGEDFIKKYPAILEYKASDPNVNIEKLYLAMAKVSPKQDSTSRTTNGSNDTQPQVDLAKRAQQLATVRDGVSNSVVAEKPNTKLSVQQAAEKAIRDLFGN